MFELIHQFMSQSGYLGVFALMALENIFPPIPSELIMPLAGFTAARGELNVILVVLAGTAGSVAGSLPWYYAGRIFGPERLKHLAEHHGRWLTVAPRDIDKALIAFQRRGRMAILFGRLVPAIRTLISIPAGIAKLSLGHYLVYSSAGSLAWTGLLTAAGYLLESQYELVASYIDPIAKTIVGAIVAVYLYRIATYRPAT
jgi:membrane protein DedA with SNARE-associated domain